MIAALGLSGRQMAEIELYAAIEPVGEAMADYTAGDRAEVTDEQKARLQKLAKRQKREIAQQKKKEQ